MIKKRNDNIVSLTINGEEWADRATAVSVSCKNVQMTELSITILCRSVEIVEEYDAWIEKEMFGGDG